MRLAPGFQLLSSRCPDNWNLPPCCLRHIVNSFHPPHCPYIPSASIIIKDNFAWTPPAPTSHGKTHSPYPRRILGLRLLYIILRNTIFCRNHQLPLVYPTQDSLSCNLSVRAPSLLCELGVLWVKLFPMSRFLSVSKVCGVTLRIATCISVV